MPKLKQPPGPPGISDPQKVFFAPVEAEDSSDEIDPLSLFPSEAEAYRTPPTASPVVSTPPERPAEARVASSWQPDSASSALLGGDLPAARQEAAELARADRPDSSMAQTAVNAETAIPEVAGSFLGSATKSSARASTSAVTVAQSGSSVELSRDREPASRRGVLTSRRSFRWTGPDSLPFKATALVGLVVLAALLVTLIALRTSREPLVSTLRDSLTDSKPVSTAGSLSGQPDRVQPTRQPNLAEDAQSRQAGRLASEHPRQVATGPAAAVEPAAVKTSPRFPQRATSPPTANPSRPDSISVLPRVPARDERSSPAVRAAQPRATSGGTKGTHVGTLVVESRPPGAQVFVDQRLVGSTPLVLPGLPVGSHVVRIVLDGYQPWPTSARIVADKKTTLKASLERNPDR